MSLERDRARLNTARAVFRRIAETGCQRNDAEKSPRTDNSHPARTTSRRPAWRFNRLQQLNGIP